MNLSEKKRIALLTFGNDLFQSEVMIKCLTAEAARFGFDLLVVNGGRYQVSQGMEYMHNTLYSYLHEGLIDGLIINKIFEYDDFEERAAHLPNWESLPKVSLANPMKNIPSVLIDNRTGFSDLMDHLILEQGCEKFGLVVPRLETSLRDFTERESIFYEKLRENNIEIDDECVFRGRYDYEGGKKVVVDQILKDRHDIQALVCLNDELALGAIREIQKRGKQVPYDIKVTGFDNSAESSFIYPSLTTVTYPFTQIAERGMELMYSLINNKPVPKETYVPTYFIPRLSSGYSLTETVHSKYYRFDIENSRTEGYTIEAALESFRSGNLSDVAAFHLKNSNLYMSDEQLDDICCCCSNNIGAFQNIDFLTNTQRLYSEIEKQIMLCNSKWEHSVLFWPDFFSSLLNWLRNALSADEFGKLKHLENELLNFTTRFAYGFLHQKEMENHYIENLVNSQNFATKTISQHALGFDFPRLFEKLNIHTCYIAVYTDNEKTKARIIFQYENGEMKKPKNDEINPEQDFLPLGNRELLSWSYLDALHLLQEHIGYIVVDFGKSRPGAYTGLARMMSSHFKMKELIDALHHYSQKLENRVEERTWELQEANLELQRQIDLTLRMEKEVIKQKNMESLATLAGGIAHDFNNFLTTIIGNISLLKDEEGLLEYHREYLKDIMSAATNAKNLTKQLMTFSKGNVIHVKTLSVVPIIREVVHFTLHGTAVSPDIDLPNIEVPIEMDKALFSQVLTNIILNAVHAMPGGGRMEFEGTLRLGKKQYGLKDDKTYFCLRISDYGVGIPKDQVGHIFDPYFTTKLGGSGLGLASSLSIIKQHSGNIIVESEEGEGTDFFIYLPVSSNAVEKQEETRLVSLDKKYKILILDDNPQIRHSLKTMLQRLGQDVSVSENGHDTIEIFRDQYQRQRGFDCVILDVTVVGGIGAFDIIDKIRAVDPEVKIIVSTGYIGEAGKKRLSEDEEYHMFEKPYSIEELSLALKEVLEK